VALTRVLALAAIPVAAATGVFLLVAAVRTPGYAAADYLSELGVGAAPQAALYRVAVVCAALGVGLVAGALRGYRVVAASLGASAFLFVGSAAVSCTLGCPLPPHDATTTVQDVIHAGVSAAALGCAGLGMLALAGPCPDRLVRAASRGAGWLVLVLMAATGAALLVQSHGLVNGVLERCVVAVALAWLLTVSARLATRPASSAPWLPAPAGGPQNRARGDCCARRRPVGRHR
jgi:hypothetical protein